MSDTLANVDSRPWHGYPDGSSEGIDARIAPALAALDGVGTVALFGSRARNRARPNSDLDVAILPETADPTRRRRLVSRAAAALAGLAPNGRVDVVLVDEAPESPA